MIVAYNALSVRPGIVDGGATFTLNVLSHLPAEIADGRVIVYSRADEDRVPHADNVEIVRVATARGPISRIGSESLALSRDLSRRRVDVLVSPNESLPLRLPCPTVVVAQNLVYHCAPASFTGATLVDRARTTAQFAYWRRRMRGAYRRAAHIIAVSEETRRVLAARAGLESARCTVSHEGADSFLLPEPWADVVTTPRILVVSVLAPYKGLEETIDLFRLLRVLHPELRLEIVGGDWRGFGAVVRRQIASARLNDVVRIRGNVTPAELAKLYAGSLLLLFLSRCESFGLPLVEAMRLGLPTVAADRSSLPEVAGGASLLVDPDRIEDAATQVATLVQDEAARADLAMRGRARAAQLTWRGTAAAIAYAVREVASRSV